MQLVLRPEQQQVVEAVSEAFRAGHKRVMVCAPCGFGKTELATAMLQATHRNRKAGAFLADRISLVNQTSERFDRYELPHGIMQAQHPRYLPDERIQVCSIATLIRRKWPAVNLIFVDEAHVLPGAVRRKLEARDCYAVGLSATPITRGLGKFFDVVVNAPTTNELIEMGRLVPLTFHSFDEPDMSDCEVSDSGEWTGQKAEERVMQVVGNVVTKYVADGRGEQFIGFAWSIRHAEEMQRQFLAAGINCGLYTSAEHDDDRAEALAELRRPGTNMRGVWSVAALTRGFDQTNIALMLDARPLRSATHEYIQMLGRIMRSHEGKTEARVFDHSGNALHFWRQRERLFRFGVTELDDARPKERNGEQPEEEEPLPRKCPQCSTLHKPRPSCPSCGFEYPTREIAHVEGELREIKAQPLKGGSELWAQVCWIVKHQRKPRDAEHAEKMAQGIYADLVGHFARGKYATTEPAAPTNEVAKKVKHLQIKWAKRRDKERREGAPA